MSQKDSRSQGQRSAVSVTSSKRNNALIEMASVAKYNGRKKSMVVNSRRNDTAADTTSLVAAVNVMRTSNYQNDPLAAMMQTRSLGLT